MVTGPYSIDRLIEDTFARHDVQRVSSVRPKPHKDVVDSSERPIAKWTHALYHPVLHARIVWGECMARVFGMSALPGIPIADTHIPQRLSSRPEAYVRCVRSEEHTSELQSLRHLV